MKTLRCPCPLFLHHGNGNTPSTTFTTTMGILWKRYHFIFHSQLLFNPRHVPWIHDIWQHSNIPCASKCFATTWWQSLKESRSNLHLFLLVGWSLLKAGCYLRILSLNCQTCQNHCHKKLSHPMAKILLLVHSFLSSLDHCLPCPVVSVTHYLTHLEGKGLKKSLVGL